MPLGSQLLLDRAENDAEAALPDVTVEADVEQAAQHVVISRPEARIGGLCG